MAGSETPRARRPEAEACARAPVSVRDPATSPGLVCVRASARVPGPVPVGDDAAGLCDSETALCDLPACGLRGGGRARMRLCGCEMCLCSSGGGQGRAR